MVDLVNHRAVIRAKEDRISNLPDDIIHHIMSFLDIIDYIRTSKLSRRWRYIWTSMPHLNLNSCRFRVWSKFTKFSRQVLSHRNNRAQVSAVALTYAWAAIHCAVENIVRYAYSHNVQQQKIVWLSDKSHEFPQFIFSSHTLKHLTLVYSSNKLYAGYFPYLPKSAWDFPALETLILRNIHMGLDSDGSDKNVNLFSKCVNLKDITLDGHFSYSLEVFNICAPQLSNLTITAPNFANVINVVAPRLENLKLSVYPTSCFNFSRDGFVSLNKVYITWWPGYVPKGYDTVLLDLLQQLRSLKFLILDVESIESLSSSLDKLSHEPCPLHDLRCLTINTRLGKQKDLTGSICAQIRKYFLENSPSASLIMNLPQEFLRNGCLKMRLEPAPVHHTMPTPVQSTTPTPVHRTTTGTRRLCPSDHNRHLLPPRIRLPVFPVRRSPSPMNSPVVRISNIHLTAGVRSSFRPPVQPQLPPPLLSVFPVRRAPSLMGSPCVRIPNIHLTAGVQSSFRPPVQQQLPPPPLPSGPQKRTRCPIHNGALANKAAKLEVEETRVVGAKSPMLELIEVLRQEKAMQYNGEWEF